MLTGFPLRAIYAHWWARSEDGRHPPRRADLDVLDWPTRLLPHAYICEREDGGRFKCRLTGTRFAEELGYEPTGRYIDGKFDTRPCRRRIELFAECVEAPRALYYRARLGVIGHDHRESGRLLLPVADTDGTVRFVYGGMMVARLADAVSARADDGGMIEVHRSPPFVADAGRSCG